MMRNESNRNDMIGFVMFVSLFSPDMFAHSLLGFVSHNLLEGVLRTARTVWARWNEMGFNRPGMTNIHWDLMVI